MELSGDALRLASVITRRHRDTRLLGTRRSPKRRRLLVEHGDASARAESPG